MLADILAAHPAAEPALTMLASNYVQTNRLPQAITLVERAHAAEPSNRRITASLGDLYVRDGKPQKALDLANGEKGASASSLPIMSLKASALIALGQKESATGVLTDILKADPTQLGVRRQLAGMLVEAGNFEQARNTIKAGIAATPRNFQLYQDYVMLDLKATGIDAALASADQLQSQDRDFVPARALRGDVYLAANRPADAIQAYTDALAAAPSTMLATRLAGAQMRAGRPEDAAKTLTAWIEKHPDDGMALEQLAEVNIATNHLPEAAKALETLLAKQPHNPLALNNLAWVYQQQNDKRAMELARQAYILSPGPQTADTLGWILTTEGKSDTGVALLRQAAAEGARDPRIAYHYAVALKNTGDKAQAIKILDAVAKAQGDFAEKTQAQQLLTELNKGS
jgi:putative PEP-CTERM system TPR-repeat lipoprotein